MLRDIKSPISVELGGGIDRRKEGEITPDGENPPSQLNVARVSPLTVLVLYRCGTHGSLRTACIPHSGHAAYIHTYIHKN